MKLAVNWIDWPERSVWWMSRGDGIWPLRCIHCAYLAAQFTCFFFVFLFNSFEGSGPCRVVIVDPSIISACLYFPFYWINDRCLPVEISVPPFSLFSFRASAAKPRVPPVGLELANCKWFKPLRNELSSFVIDIPAYRSAPSLVRWSLRPIIIFRFSFIFIFFFISTWFDVRVRRFSIWNSMCPCSDFYSCGPPT